MDTDVFRAGLVSSPEKGGSERQVRPSAEATHHTVSVPIGRGRQTQAVIPHVWTEMNDV
jgi:hypothetical protein